VKRMYPTLGLAARMRCQVLSGDTITSRALIIPRSVVPSLTLGRRMRSFDSSRKKNKRLSSCSSLFNSKTVKVDLGIWSKLTRVVIFLLVLAGISAVAVWYLPLIKQNERYRREILRLDAQVQKAEERVRLAKSQVRALEYDPKTVERLAREKFGYAKVGETVIRFEEKANR